MLKKNFPLAFIDCTAEGLQEIIVERDAKLCVDALIYGLIFVGWSILSLLSNVLV